MSTSKQDKCFQVIEYIIFFGLLGLSFFLMYEVLDKYISRKTVITQSEVPITELPTIIICFSKQNSYNTKYEYESDFKIKLLYWDWDQSDQIGSIFVKEGENTTLFGEIIWLEKIITAYRGNCFKITSILTNPYLIRDRTIINIYFNESITEEDFPNWSYIFVTSEKNSYGIVSSNWMNGKILRTQIDAGMRRDFDLKPVQHSYLTTHPKCSHEAYYDCVSKSILASIKKGVSSQCSMISLPLLPLCKINKTIEEQKEFLEAYSKGNDQCFGMTYCIVSEYSADEIAYRPSMENGTFEFGFIMSSNSTTIYEEYLIHDGINAIGSVGGTLGMCIGFSFTGLASYLLNILKHLISIIKAEIA